MSAVRARVELRDVPYQDRDTAFKKLLQAFKRARADAGIDHDMRRYEAYEKPGEKKRRKLRQNESARLKAKLKENFPERGKDKKKGDK